MHGGGHDLEDGRHGCEFFEGLEFIATPGDVFAFDLLEGTDRAEPGANFTGKIVAAVEDLAAHDNASADAGAHAEAYEVLQSARFAEPEFRHGHGADVVLDEYVYFEPFGKAFAEGDVVPIRDVGVIKAGLGIRLDQAGHADADAEDVAVVLGEFFDGVLDLADDILGTIGVANDFVDLAHGSLREIDEGGHDVARLEIDADEAAAAGVQGEQAGGAADVHGWSAGAQ